MILFEFNLINSKRFVQLPKFSLPGDEEEVVFELLVQDSEFREDILAQKHNFLRHLHFKIRIHFWIL